MFSLRQIGPIWGGSRGDYSPAMLSTIDRVTLALFLLSTIWFVLHVLIEFRNFTSYEKDSWLDLATFLVFFFPPVIMSTVYAEVAPRDRPSSARPVSMAAGGHVHLQPGRASGRRDRRRSGGRPSRPRRRSPSSRPISCCSIMPGASGLDVAASLGKPRPAVIFCTAFDQYAVDAFELSALDYLLKPVNRARLAASLDRVRAAATPSSRDRAIEQLTQSPGLAPTRFLARRGNRFRDKRHYIIRG